MMKLWECETPGYNPEFSAEEPTLVPYLIEDGVKRGAVIVFPGGGYGHRSFHEGEPVALWMNRLGLNAFVLNYRVAPYRHPYPLMDAKRAIRLVRHNASQWNTDATRICILGFSAGGHLAASAGTLFDNGDPDAEDAVERESSRPDAMILCYPVITLGEFRHDGSRRNLLGDEPDEKLIHQLSIENSVSDQTPPAFIWHTANDKGVPVENSLMMAAALSKNKIPFEIHVFRDGKHGLGLAENIPEVNMWTKNCENWLKSAGIIGVSDI